MITPWIHQTVLAMSLPAMLLVGMLKGFSLTVQSIRGSFRLHNDMLSKVVRAPIGFFDKTPGNENLKPGGYIITGQIQFAYESKWKIMTFFSWRYHQPFLQRHG